MTERRGEKYDTQDFNLIMIKVAYFHLLFFQGERLSSINPDHRSLRLKEFEHQAAHSRHKF